MPHLVSPAAALEPEKDAVQGLEHLPSELLLKPFKLAVATNNVKLQEMSLACLHKVLAHGVLADDAGEEVCAAPEWTRNAQEHL